MFVKYCKKKYAQKYKIAIPGINMSLIRHKILIDSNTKDCQFNISDDHKTIEINGKGVSTLINKWFNNGHEYIYTNTRTGIEWSHDNNCVKWSENQQQTLTFSGNLKSRIHGYPWGNL